MQDEAGAPLTGADPTPSPAPDPSPEGRSRLRALLLTIAAVVLVLDQGTKAWALARLTPGEPVDLVGSAIRLNLIRNPGAAFSLGDGSTWVLTLVSLVILGWVLVAVRRVDNRGWAIPLGLLLGGAVGNLVDRLVREPGPGRGHVVDFIDYFGWFVGNVADIAIVVAAGVVMVLAYRGVPLGSRRDAEHGAEPADG
ncbi:signal peptidase II [Phycicoccus sonneratiae]|uniref:Lipoprotein signal peptidase n=1 Tax=Phycicoccus sonneratiae TaxID=2807628 RepID=A0ABS2CJZ5_9MICO|nr:signal peptidase II [Phycicoccus sonneraticus]MBM6400205.1 signal peptidase II [Phycicoccus sonneraticus]